MVPSSLIERPPRRRNRSNTPFKGDREAQGFVIDDYFSVCVHDLKDPGPPTCAKRLAHAKRIYESAGLVSSDDKDIVAQPVAKIAGAEVCSSRTPLAWQP